MEKNVFAFLKQKGVDPDSSKYTVYYEIERGLQGTIFEDIADQVAEGIAIEGGWLPNNQEDLPACLEKLKRADQKLTPEEIVSIDQLAAIISAPTMTGVIGITSILIDIEGNAALKALLSEIQVFIQMWCTIEDPDRNDDIDIDEVAQSVFDFMKGMEPKVATKP